MAELKVKISELNQGTPLSTDIIPYVDLVSGETKKALKSELKGDTGLAATADAGTTTTLAAGQNATVTNVGTPSDAIFNFAIPQGIQGITGATGAKVISVAFSGNDIVFTLDDSSTVTLTNAKIDLKGDKGDNGSDGTNGVDGAVIVSGAFSGDDLVFTLSDSSTATVIGAKTDLRGIQGIQGIPGATGNGISNISLISTVGLVKTYRITYTDSTTFDYTVTDGENGTNGIDGIDGTSFTWKGAYAGGTAYVKNDNVSYNGSSYIAKSNTTGNLPTNATYWDLLAEKGADGSGAGDMLASVYDADGGAKQVAFKDQLHNAVTVTDTAEIDMTLTGQDIKADIKTASIAKSKLDSSVQTSLGKADSAIQDISGKEDVSNKKTSLADNSDTFYPTQKAVKTAVDAKQDTLAFTPENSANKENTTINTSTTKYPTVNLLKTVKDVADAKMSNPMSATGDIIYGGASGVATRLAKGTDGQILELESGSPAWKTKGVTPINAKTGSYTLVLSDAGKLITLTSSGAITLTIPTNASVAFPIGTQIDLSQMGAGKVTFAGAGVTINSKGGNKTIADKFVGVSLIKTDTNTWLLVGDLIA